MNCSESRCMCVCGDVIMREEMEWVREEIGMGEGGDWDGVPLLWK